MITKERLQELIEQRADVYMARYYTEGIHLEPENFEVNDKELVFKYKIYVVPLEDLFETQYEAEWHKEFGNIIRTERLELPSWEEFKNRECPFGFNDNAKIYRYYVYKDLKRIEIREYFGRGARVVFSEPLTKENYILACRKCKELFLGGEDVKD